MVVDSRDPHPGTHCLGRPCDLTKVFGARIKSLKELQSCWDRWQLGFQEEEGEEGAGSEPGKMDYRTGVAEKKANHGGIGQRIGA